MDARRSRGRGLGLGCGRGLGRGLRLSRWGGGCGGTWEGVLEGWRGRRLGEEGVYQLYTSADGGKIFFPDSASDFRNRLRSRKALLVTSSFNAPSQLSCNVLISSARSSFCSCVSFAIQASLSNLTGSVAGAVGDDAGADGLAVDKVLAEALGWPKNEVMDPFAFGFFAASAAMSAALRLSDIFPSRIQFLDAYNFYI